MVAHRHHAFVPTSLGDLLLVAEPDALVGLYFPQHRYPPAPGAIGRLVDEGAHGVIDQAARRVREYLAGERQEFDVRVRTAGTAFFEDVWRLLGTIPFGETTTYGALATQLGNARLAQSVGRAVGRNPVSIIIPCHRVVGATGGLTGFAGGLDRKRALLDLEARGHQGRLF
jgi:methylated-DNA-[protein]-cysteine S-methyltransferase